MSTGEQIAFAETGSKLVVGGVTRDGYITPTEILRSGFEVKISPLGTPEGSSVGMDIIRFPDYNGQPVNIPRLFIDGEVESGLRGFGANIEVTKPESSLVDKVVSNLNSGVPVLFAVRSAEAGKTSEVKHRPQVIMGVCGEKGSGKSLVTAAMGLRFDYSFATLDQFSFNSPVTYTDAFKEAGLTNKSSGSEILRVVKEVRLRNKVLKNKNREIEVKPVSTILDQIIAKNVHSNSEIFLLENMSTPNETLDLDASHLIRDSAETTLVIVTGNDNEMDRMLKGCGRLKIMGNSLILTTPYSSEEGKTLLSGTALEEFLGRFAELSPEIVKRGLARRQEFCDAIKSSV